MASEVDLFVWYAYYKGSKVSGMQLCMLASTTLSKQFAMIGVNATGL